MNGNDYRGLAWVRLNALEIKEHKWWSRVCMDHDFCSVLWNKWKNCIKLPETVLQLCYSDFKFLWVFLVCGIANFSFWLIVQKNLTLAVGRIHFLSIKFGFSFFSIIKFRFSTWVIQWKSIKLKSKAYG